MRNGIISADDHRGQTENLPRHRPIHRGGGRSHSQGSATTATSEAGLLAGPGISPSRGTFDLARNRRNSASRAWQASLTPGTRCNMWYLGPYLSEI